MHSPIIPALSDHSEGAPFTVANALSEMEHAVAWLLLGLGGQQLVTTLSFTMAASVEAVRPDRAAPREIKPAKAQGFYPALPVRGGRLNPTALGLLLGLSDHGSWIRIRARENPASFGA